MLPRASTSEQGREQGNYKLPGGPRQMLKSILTGTTSTGAAPPAPSSSKEPLYKRIRDSITLAQNAGGRGRSKEGQQQLVFGAAVGHQSGQLQSSGSKQETAAVGPPGCSGSILVSSGGAAGIDTKSTSETCRATKTTTTYIRGVRASSALDSQKQLPRRNVSRNTTLDSREHEDLGGTDESDSRSDRQHGEDFSESCPSPRRGSSRSSRTSSDDETPSAVRRGTVNLIRTKKKLRHGSTTSTWAGKKNIKSGKNNRKSRSCYNSCCKKGNRCAASFSSSYQTGVDMTYSFVATKMQFLSKVFEFHDAATRWLAFLFLGHACSSIVLILMNKSIAIRFPHNFTTVAVQNLGTLGGAGFLHVTGIHALKLPPRKYLWRIVLNSAWLITVLWASIAALGKVSVPLYVLARNTVPFLTALLDRVLLGVRMSWRTIGGLLLTFVGTAIYTLAEAEMEYTGLIYAMLNVVFVSTICVYESVTMKLVKKELSAIQLNFYRVLFSMPFLPPILYYEWTSASVGFAEIQELIRPVFIQLVLSALLAFSIGSFLLGLQGLCSATTIQLANISYKFVTTMVSRLTHPSEVQFIGWVGYAICTAGLVQYAVNPAKATPVGQQTVERQKLDKKSGKKQKVDHDEDEEKAEEEPKTAPPALFTQAMKMVSSMKQAAGRGNKITSSSKSPKNSSNTANRGTSSSSKKNATTVGKNKARSRTRSVSTSGINNNANYKTKMK
ncbi:unnamed protein product [Amoebophrya sp. A120]|nr:unnamed protein product [Amoebophrya sp. A120]|eukprot:GSA120T00016233001.1